MTTETGVKVDLKNNLISQILCTFKTQVNTHAKYKSLEIQKKWESLNVSPYCYWTAALDEPCPYSPIDDVLILEYASMSIFPRLKKSPLSEEIFFALPREVVLALDFIAGQECTFKAIAGYLGLRSEGGIGTPDFEIHNDNIESHVNIMLNKVLNAIPQVEIERRTGQMSSQIFHIFIKLGRLNRSHMKLLEGSQRDELFSADLGL